MSYKPQTVFMSRHGQGVGRKGAYIFVRLEVQFYILLSTYILWEIVK